MFTANTDENPDGDIIPIHRFGMIMNGLQSFFQSIVIVRAPFLDGLDRIIRTFDSINSRPLLTAVTWKPSIWSYIWSLKSIDILTILNFCDQLRLISPVIILSQWNGACACSIEVFKSNDTRLNISMSCDDISETFWSDNSRCMNRNGCDSAWNEASLHLNCWKCFFI